MFDEWPADTISGLRFLSDSIKLLDKEQVDELQAALISAIDDLLDGYGV